MAPAPPARLTTPLGEVGLYGVNQDRDQRSGNTNVTDMPTFGSDDAFLSSFTQTHEGTLQGTATGLRLARSGGYPDDPVEALATWVQEVMSLISGSQGDGYTLDHDVRGYDSKPVAIDSFQWTRNEASLFEVSWSLSLRIGDVTMSGDASVNPGEVNPSSEWSIDGVDLQYPKEISESTQQQLNTDEMLFGDGAEDNVITSGSGATRRINISGTHTGTRSERRDFDDAMRSLIGESKVVDYESPFPGHTLTVGVDNFDSSLEAGRTGQTDYTLELIEGESAGGTD